jgi:hypothetical protein
VPPLGFDIESFACLKAGFIAPAPQHVQNRHAPGLPTGAMNVCLKARDSQANR